MKVDDQVQCIIDSIQNDEVKKLLQQIDDTDFGIYIPAYEDQGVLKPMLEGYSQTEKNLIVSISKNEDNPEDALPVGWFSTIDAKDSSCSHPKEDKCRHCTGHQDKCRHCTHPKNHSEVGIDGAPELDYGNVVNQIDNYKNLIKSLSTHGLGLTLLHGHNKEFMFTQLPIDYVSVIVNGKTIFRTKSDVENDPTFVPNSWRSVNGELVIAGGHSEKE